MILPPQLIIPRDYQFEAAAAPRIYYERGGKGNPVVAMPTGTGKSVVIAMTVMDVMLQFRNHRVMMLTHVKELIEQNAAKLLEMWPTAPLGIYSAGMKRKEQYLPITYGGCASVVKCVPDFGHIDILFIDEAHLVSPNDATMYQRIIAELKIRNPFLKVIGYTATQYRLGQGMITDQPGIFTDTCCDMTGLESFNRFIREGYLAQIYPKRVKNLRVSDVNIRSKGDFTKAALAADAAKKDVTYKALYEMCEAFEEKSAWMVFASTIEDADFIEQTLKSFGFDVPAVHSGLSDGENDDRINDFKEGKVRGVVNMGKLTTGFDHKYIDAIGVLRRTSSPGLWVQMLGRGTRPVYADGYDLQTITGRLDAMYFGQKQQGCLVMDFAGNTRRLGPINDPITPKPRGAGGGGEAPVKICPEDKGGCETYNHTSARNCIFCGYEFEFKPNISMTADTAELIRTTEPVHEVFDVSELFYFLHSKPGRPPSIRVQYRCSGGAQLFDEYINFEAYGKPRTKAVNWWRQRFPGSYMPTTTAEALAQCGQLRRPSKIRVHINQKYPEIVDYAYPT